MLLEMYDYASNASFQFDSITTNPDFSGIADMGYTGMLDVSAGDVLEWECHIVNDSDVGLRYINSVQEGEMCNVFAWFVGPEPSDCVIP